MEIIVRGNRYKYKILNSQMNENKCLFSIKAVHKNTKRTSSITTLNIILSALDIKLKESRFWESDWVANYGETIKFISRAKQLFSNKAFLPFVENYLDLDRKESEWENYEKL